MKSAKIKNPDIRPSHIQLREQNDKAYKRFHLLDKPTRLNLPQLLVTYFLQVDSYHGSLIYSTLWKVKTIRGEIIKGARMYKVKIFTVGPCKADEL